MDYFVEILQGHFFDRTLPSDLIAQVHCQLRTLIVLGTLFLSTSVASVWMSYLQINERALGEYTFIGDDFPSHYPIVLPTILLTPERTVHYQIDSPEAAVEWASVFPRGGGFLRLGASNRSFGLSLYHQMHCLERIREAILAGNSNGHVHHCFNYLRQIILCDASPALEPVFFTRSGRRMVNSEVPRVCKDWGMVYNMAEDNYLSALYKGTVRTSL